MGNALPSEKNQKNESVINLSDNCVSRITKDETQSKSKPYELAEDEWVERLKCMDDEHSDETGITYQNVVNLLNKIETQLQDLRPPVCDCEALVNCMKKNEHCMIKCRKYVDEFISCVDAHRVNIIKEKYDMEKRMNNMKPNDVAKEFTEQ